MSDSVLIDRSGGVARVSLNRPAVHNAFDDGLIAELTATLEALDRDPSVRAVVLSGNGKLETLKLIEGRIGLSFEQFTRAVLLAQNDFAAFLRASDDERRLLADELFGRHYIIIKLDNQEINTYAELSGFINTKRPNDKVQVSYKRDGKIYTVPVILSKNDYLSAEFKGIELENIDSADKKKFRISSGVRIKDINNDNLRPYYDELKGTIILSIDNVATPDVEAASKVLQNKDENQSISIEMINKLGQRIRIII